MRGETGAGLSPPLIPFFPSLKPVPPGPPPQVSLPRFLNRHPGAPLFSPPPAAPAAVAAQHTPSGAPFFALPPGGRNVGGKGRRCARPRPLASGPPSGTRGDSASAPGGTPGGRPPGTPSLILPWARRFWPPPPADRGFPRMSARPLRVDGAPPDLGKNVLKGFFFIVIKE